MQIARGHKGKTALRATFNGQSGHSAMAPDGSEALLMRQIQPEAAFTKVEYGTEAGYFAGSGLPTIVCGPGSMDQGHKPDEFIYTSELAACDAMCDRVLQHLGG